jgi:hypothetical protein
MSDSCSNCVEQPFASSFEPVDTNQTIYVDTEVPQYFKTEVDELYEKLMTIRKTDLMWVLQKLQKNRPDLLLLMCFSHEFFSIPPDNFKDFKEWIVEAGVLKPADMIRECLKGIEGDEYEEQTEYRPATPNK